MLRDKFGKYTFLISKIDSSRALDTVLKNNLTYDKLTFTEKRDIKLSVHSSQREKFESALSKENIGYTITENKGIAAFIFKYSKRWGLFLGIIILFTLVHLSSLFVWKIEIDGNVSVSDDEIINLLEKSGLMEGTYIPSINYDVLHNRFLKSTNSIAWISVNIDGNVAKVKVREIMEENEPQKSTYTNVTAKCDGQVLLINVIDGIKTVKISDVVKKGDILISGVIDSASDGVRYVHADGIVNAYVSKNLSVKIPMKQTVKEYTGVIYTDKSVKVFTKNINIFKKYRNYNTLCDKIETSEYIKLFNGREIPVQITDTSYLEYIYKDVEYSYSEAKDIASAELKRLMDKELADAILVSQRVSHYCDFEYYYIDCQLYCIENIAELTEFEVTEE